MLANRVWSVFHPVEHGEHCHDGGESKQAQKRQPFAAMDQHRHGKHGSNSDKHRNRADGSSKTPQLGQF